MFNLDQVDRPGQEEFIWAMRTRTYDDDGDDDLWRDRRITSSMVTRLGRSEASLEAEAERIILETCTRTISSMVPDEILGAPANFNDRIYDAAVLKGNITGLQALWDKYRVIGKGGPFRMAQVLNTYLGNVMQEAFVYNGDVISCGGVTFCVMWKQGNRSMSDCVHQAVDCGLSLTKAFQNVETDVGIKVGVHIGISCGPVTFCAIGTPKRTSFVLIGDPLEDAKEMVSKIARNEVMVDQEVWEYLNSIEYIARAYDGEYDLYIIMDFSSAWRSIQITNDKNEDDVSDNQEEINSYTSLSQVTKRKENHEIYELRPSIGDAINMHVYPLLKSYIFPPLLEAVQAEEPIESLIEMRYMVVMVAGFAFEPQNYHNVVLVTDKYYRMINNIIEPYKGYILRISFKENVLIYYVLFGIRGDKSNLEFQNALKAAMKCFKGSENSDWLWLGMGVVSGWVFCGPVGHHMRREYVAIGSNLEKARRLVEEYPNQVSCDLETFLRSKLDSRNFILQDKKADDEGISDLGCVYQYVEFDRSNHIPKFALNKYPLLDREHELERFKWMLHIVSKLHKVSEVQRYRVRYEPTGLFLLGEPRSGKTRIIEELLYATPTEYPMFRLRLNAMDKQIPYQTIYYIFGFPLGFADNSTTADREAKLSSKFRELPLDGLECVLNIVFRVNFPKLPVIGTLKQAEIANILRNLVQWLCRVCFAKPWVIFIDCGQYIDVESWELLYAILETHRVVFVVAVGCTQSELPPSARNVLSQTKCKCLNLLPIDKMHHASLACQMLDCAAIPIELEKTLHDKSNGSPGWIENFLFALMHSGVIWIRKVESLPPEHTHDLVVPSKETMSRGCMKLSVAPFLKPTPSTLQQGILLFRKTWEIFETVAVSDDEKRIAERIDELISTSFVDHKSNDRSSSTSSTKSGIAGSKSMSSLNRESSHLRRRIKGLSASAEHSAQSVQAKTFNICVMAPNAPISLSSFVFDDVSLSATRRIMDVLSSFEMFFLKAASVIGDFFLRDMLIFVMSCSDERKIALACERLFELKIIACGEGDFRRSLMNYSPVMSDRYKTYDDTVVSCNCVGFLISQSCKGYSKHANCGYMRFLNQDFRGAAYNLLTIAQLNELHSKAMSYLEKSTRKCVSCGNGVFTKILGNRYEEGVLAMGKSTRSMLKVEGDIKTSASVLENWDIVGHSSSSRSSGLKRFERTRLSKGDIGIIFQPYSKAGVTGEKAKIPRAFEDTDFTRCECDKILYCLYFHVRHHYEATGRYDKWLYATLEYAALCIEDSNMALALKSLNHALEVIKGPYKEMANPGESWKYDVMKALVMAQVGRARFMIGQHRLAYKAYARALELFGYRLPTPSSLRYKLIELWEHVKITSKTRRGIGTKFGYCAEFCDSVSDCLGMMAKLFVGLEMWDNAYISALWSLKKALQSEKSFLTMVNAFTNLIYISARKRKYAIADPVEVMALDYCRRYKCVIDVNDMRAIARLYAAIFYIRVQRACFEDAFAIGFCVDPMMDMLNLRGLLIKLFPLFFEMLLMKTEIYEMLNALTTFEQIVGPAGDYLGDVWFYSQATYLHLHTGCVLISINLAEEYYYTQNKRLVDLRNPEAERRYFVAIWLWHLRMEHHAIASIWESKLPKAWTVEPHESINNLITTLMYLEGLIISVTFKMDRKMIALIEEAHVQIKTLFRLMEAQAERVRIIAPRLMHLKAYFYMCRMEDFKGWETLDKAIKLALSMENLFDAAWAQHSERAWKQDMPETERNCWRDQAMMQMDHSDVEQRNYKIVYYTLEMPLYL